MTKPHGSGYAANALDMACWPRWTEAARVDEAASARAYETTPPACRTALKTGLALAHMHFGQRTGRRREERCDDHPGFWRHSNSFPAPWAIVAFTPGYTAAARLAAACVPALLAGVPLLGAVCVGGAPSDAALVSLELCGVEDVFLLDTTGLSALLEECQPGPGRLLLLHSGELDGALRTARVLDMPCYEERRPPTLVLPDPEAFDLQALTFAQGEALEHALEPSRPPMPAALYLKPDAAQGHCKAHKFGPFYYAASLALSPGCEGFWLHKGLTPDFFRIERLAFGPDKRNVPDR
ncbi:MAG: hypothetical protein LBB60_06620 [Desulfovibrio sp.]|jgi:hypothetical protein|nr:hypothetical protein [Desulfovibrio sp.]